MPSDNQNVQTSCIEPRKVLPMPAPAERQTADPVWSGPPVVIPASVFEKLKNAMEAENVTKVP